MIAVVFSAKKKGESRYEEKIPDRPGAGGARVPAFVVSDRISEGGQKSRPLSPHHRFVIAMHSPDGVLESGLLGCLPEKKVRKPACRIGQDTFSGPLCVKDSRNYGQFERFHKNCGLFSLHVRLYGGARGIRTLGPVSGTP